MNLRLKIKQLIGVFGYEVFRSNSWQLIRTDWTTAQTRSNQLANLERVVDLLSPSALGAVVKQTNNSMSQLGQDLWVLGNTSEAGTFLEIGAFDGFALSNTLLLENMGWQGYLVEPMTYLKQKDRRCETYNVAVGVSGLVQFALTKQPEYSTRLDLVDKDGLTKVRKDFRVITVKSITVKELMLQLNQPRHINYVSIDTEGNEWEIISQWDFSSCTVDFWTIETNGRPDQWQIDKLLFTHGYCYIENNSGFDRWYTKHHDSSCLSLHRLMEK